MSRYDELCSALGDHNQASRDYWDSLKLRAAQIADGLSKYLEYPFEKYPTLDGGGFTRYVLLTKPGEEQECYYVDLPCQDGAVQFDLIVTIEEKTNQFPKLKLRFPLHIGSNGNVLKVWNDHKTIAADIQIGDQNVDHLYASIFSAVKDFLQQRPILK